MLKEGYHSYMAMSIIFLPILQFFHTFPFPKGETMISSLCKREVGRNFQNAKVLSKFKFLKLSFPGKLLPLPWRLPARSRFGKGRGED
jgi:hypothetical protein